MSALSAHFGRLLSAFERILSASGARFERILGAFCTRFEHILSTFCAITNAL
jgi:hypothetical protein